MVTLHSHATRLGVLDIGSNTVHMLIVDAAPGARPEPEASTKSTIRLMQYLKDDGSIKKAGIEALLSAVEKVGLYQLIFPFYALCLSLSTSGLETAISRSVSRFHSLGRTQDGKLIFQTGLILSVLISLICTFLVQKNSVFLSCPLTIIWVPIKISASCLEKADRIFS